MENNMTEQTAATETETPEQETVGNPTVEPEPAEDPATALNHADDPNETFPRKYVEELRKEAANYREKAKGVEDLQRRLHEQLVKADGRLADPADLEFDPEHLEDGDALDAAITALIEKKPGLRAQQITGDVGAGARGPATAQEADLISIIRGM